MRFIRLGAAAWCAAIAIAFAGPPTLADPGVAVTPESLDYVVEAEDARDKASPTGPTSPGATVIKERELVYLPACLLGGASVCDTTQTCDGTGVMFNVFELVPDGSRRFVERACLGGESTSAEPVRPEVTNAMVLRALRRVGVPEPVLAVEPPGGRTLVNLETIFSTEAEPFDASVRILGQRVDLQVEPVGFVWSHGDGTEQRSNKPGRAYAQGVAFAEYLTHVYTEAGVTVRPRVAVEYGARFRVDGGEWRDVVGTVTVAGDPVDLRVVEARPELVSVR